MKRKIIVTGITGFVGQNLEPYLAKDFDIVGVSRTKISDTLNYENFFREKPDYIAIVHLAGKVHDMKKTSNDNEYYDANYQLTKKLYCQFLQSDAEKFIYISSVKAVADTVEGVLTEERAPHPITAYGKSKLMAEEFILANLPNNKKVFILRPCMIHGSGNKGNLNLLYSLVSKSFPWPLGAFENQRSFLSVENLCFVIRELLENESVPSGVYNVADDIALSTNELIELIALSQQKKARILSIPKKLILGIVKIGNVLNFPLNPARLHKLTESYVVSNVKIVDAIGKSLPVSSREGLVSTFRAFEVRD